MMQSLLDKRHIKVLIESDWNLKFSQSPLLK